MIECPNCHYDNPENTKFCGNCATPLPVSEETLEMQTATIDASLQLLKTGSILSDRYEIIEEIGKGGMGKVYKVFDRDVHEKIALKLIRPEIASNRGIIERFRNELKMARQISHRNVCRMFDLGRHGETRFITMEYVSGEDLKKSIRRMGPLTVRKTLSIAKQICHGLSEAHEIGVIHRDLKPHNIMIDREGNVRIMDFGIALSREGEGVTGSRVLVGTPQYMSPEQVEGKKVDQRTDIYSLGVILFEMVTGQVPFDGETTMSIAVKHKTEIPPDPKAINAQIPLELSQLILKCLEKDPEKRYQSAELICYAITQIEEDFPTSETTLRRIKPESKITFLRTLLLKPYVFVLFLAVLSIGLYFFYDRVLRKGEPSSSAVGIINKLNSLVVLPFRELGPQSEEDPVSLLLTDALIVNLHIFKELRVLATSTALAYKDSKENIQTIGRELNVDMVLAGTISRHENLLRINAQLCSVEDQSVIWAKSFENPREDFQKIQDGITLSVARTLGIPSADEIYTLSAVNVPAELASNKYYNRGRHFELSYHYSEDALDFENCVENYLQVVQAYPHHPLTFWRLGNIHENRYIVEKIYKKSFEAQKYLDSMLEYYQKAYDINPQFAEANLGLGWSYFYKEDNDKAYEYVRRAIELDPDNAEVNFYTGSFFRSIGLYEQAAFRYSRGFELDPMPFLFSLWHDLRADCYSCLGRYEDAADLVKDALKIQPDRDLYLNYAWQLLMLGKYDDAETQIARAERFTPSSRFVRTYRAWLLAVRGDKTTALKLIEGEEETFRYEITIIYAILDLKDKAILNMGKGIEMGFHNRGMYFYSYPYLLHNPFYDNLRDDPRFQKIIRQEKTKYEEKLKKYGGL